MPEHSACDGKKLLKVVHAESGSALDLVRGKSRLKSGGKID
jgi:hypothetical protein